MGEGIQTRKSGLNLKGIVEEYTVQAGYSVSAGDFVEFLSGNASGGAESTFASTKNRLSACALSETSAMVFSSNKTAVVVTINGDSITIGTDVVFTTRVLNSVRAIVLSDNKVFVAFDQYATILTVSGETISVGVEYSHSISSSLRPIAKLTETSVLLTYRLTASPYYGTAVVATISGTAISFGTATNFASGISGSSVAALSSTKAVIAFSRTTSGDGSVIVLIISGTTITLGLSTLFEPEDINADGISIAKISESSCLIFYRAIVNKYLTAKVIHVQGYSIAMHPSEHSSIASAFYVCTTEVIVLDENKVLLMHHQADSALPYGKVNTVTIDEFGLTVGTEYVFKSAAVGYIAGACLSRDKAIVLSNLGASVISVPSLAKVADKRRKIKGVAKNGGASGALITVNTLGGL